MDTIEENIIYRRVYLTTVGILSIISSMTLNPVQTIFSTLCVEYVLSILTTSFPIHLIHYS